MRPKILFVSIIICLATATFLFSCKRKPEVTNKGINDTTKTFNKTPDELSTYGYPYEISIVKAIDEFNLRAMADSVGCKQSPLSPDELNAAIRGWNRLEYPMSDSIFTKFQNIAKSGIMPKGSYLYFVPELIDINGYDVKVWWIYLRLELDKYPTDLAEVPQFYYRIRTSFISSKAH